MLLDELTSLGLNKNEAKVYLALLELGSSSISELAKIAEINRTVAYSVIEQLLNKELVIESITGKKKTYSSEPPEKLKSLLKQKLKKLDEIYPELSLLLNQTKTKPVIKFFTGVEGIKRAYRLSLAAETNDLIGFTGFSVLTEASKAIDTFWKKEYIPQRKKLKKLARLIIPDNQVGKKYAAENKNHFRETKFVPSSTYDFELDLFMFDNTVIFISYTPKEEFALIINSESVAKTLKMIWQIVWTTGY